MASFNSDTAHGWNTWGNGYNSEPTPAEKDLAKIVETYGKDWEAKADALRNVLENPAILGSVRAECKKCYCGFVSAKGYGRIGYTDSCPCCKGDYLNCPNCAETEYRKFQLPANVTASAEWLKHNTHASPDEKAQAKRDGEVLDAIRRMR